MLQFKFLFIIRILFGKYYHQKVNTIEKKFNNLNDRYFTNF